MHSSLDDGMLYAEQLSNPGFQAGRLRLFLGTGSDLAACGPGCNDGLEKSHDSRDKQQLRRMK
jgi:hypothetical protein